MTPDLMKQMMESLLRTAFEKPRDEEVERAKQWTPEEQVRYVMETVPLMADRTKPRELSRPVNGLLRRKLPFSPEQILQLVEWGADPNYYFPFAAVLRLAESIPMTPALAHALDRMRSAKVLEQGYVEGSRALRRRIDDLLHPMDGSAPFQPAGSWSRHIAAEVTPAWRAVLESGAAISGSEPSQKWRMAASARVAEIGREQFRVTTLRWLEPGPSPGETGAQLDAKESDYQRGLLWLLVEFSDAETCRAVAHFAEGCLRKIPMFGAVSQKSGNACVGVLAAMSGAEPVAQLARLATRIKYATAQRLMTDALAQAAERQGLSREELEEITVPTFGLAADGRRVERLGESVLELTAEGSLTCTGADGKPLKGLPAAVKRDFPQELKELQQAAKEIGAMRAAHRIRLERLLLTGRAIPLASWRAAYLDHPLIGGLARRLIWKFSSDATAIWHEGKMVDWSGAEVAPAASARLWHPIHSDVQTVLAWRCRLEDREIRQPFKQAHREVYLVTDAERETGTYSNRFAGHILKQHQFGALCEERGWKFKLMGQWDSHNTPYLELPQAGLRAEFEVEFPRDEAVSGHAIYLYLQTGQVRFYDPERRIPRPIESIPPAIFSEVMRDVDLFVGVSSIGNDPLWNTRGNGLFSDYWGEFSFGELSAAAGERKAMLERLVPKLPIRDRCRIDGRFLWVRGDRATYKIHIGSGNVLIEPGSRFLCIVRGSATADMPAKVFLPFEGDNMLALVLSKAFFLAADKKITDRRIASQLP